jgi:2-isopropylmalate synthase
MKQMGASFEDVSKDDVKAVLAEIKAKENQGYTFESSDASFKMLAQKILNKHKAFFELEGFRVIVEKNGMQQPCISEATIKVKVNGEIEHTAGEGEGPVEALDVALRKALSRFYPEIADVVLKDYRVRILNPEDATKAVTRVLIESSDGNSRWGTVGVSPNIIEASWQALVDSVEFKMFEDETKNNVE